MLFFADTVFFEADQFLERSQHRCYSFRKCADLLSKTLRRMPR